MSAKRGVAWWALAGALVLCRVGSAMSPARSAASGPDPNAAMADTGTATLGSDARSLYLRAGTVDLRHEPSLLVTRAIFTPGERHVIQMDGPITPRRRIALQRCGVELWGYLPMYAYIATLDNVQPDALVALGFVTWVGHYQDSWKLCPNIGRSQFSTSQRRQLEAAGRKQLVVSLFANVPIDAAVARIEQTGATAVGIHPTDKGALNPGARINAGARITSRTYNYGNPLPPARRRAIEVQIAEDRVERLRGLSEVMFVEEAAEGQPRNNTTTWICQSDVLDSTPLWDAGLHGEGLLAGIIDWAMREEHCALEDLEGNPIGPDHRKIEAYYGLGVPSGYAYHGTHVAGVLMGKDADPLANYHGMAYESRVVFQHHPTVITSTSLNERLTVAHDHGATVHNNSWGNSSRDYIAWSRDIDLFTRNNEDDLVLVAVANYGEVKAPENAKNCLAVASTNDAPNQGSMCNGSYGPTADGRQKPEVWAPGCGSTSAGETHCGLHTGGGTSYAAPAVAGMGLLVRQYFLEGFYPSGAATPEDAVIPSGALLKAVLFNSGVDMDGFPDYFGPYEGWGRILMDDALYFTGDARALAVEDVRNVAGLSTGEADTYQVTVNSSDEPLKITVVWTDVPATLGASFTPVNNLDLVVTDPGGVTYLGNVFGGLESAPGGTPDALNNGEQVHRHTPVPGLWQIDIAGTEVNQDTQGYALVVTGDVSQGVNCLKGDVNGDGLINGNDISPFVSVILEGGTALEECAADMDDTGGPEGGDVDDFIAALL